jgi:catechol 2,3-dioxygenase-like lactoylglutathione lyase family enzyme
MTSDSGTAMRNPLLFSVAAIFLLWAPGISFGQAGNPDSGELKLVAQLPPELPQRIMGLAYDGNKLWATIYLGWGRYATLDPSTLSWGSNNEDVATVTKPENAAGVDHVGYGLSSFGDLIATYERLKADGITPFLPLNHSFTTSLYYHDPDGNEVELSVDNFATKEECDAFVRSEQMEEIGRPPFGYVFDPDELARLYHQGVPATTLARIGLPDGL